MVVFDSLDAIRAYVGQSAVSPPIDIPQPTIDTFADVTEDHQWLHVDVARSKAESPYGTTIAHGLLTLSLLPAAHARCFTYENRKMGLNYGFDKVRFTGPVPSGSAVTGRFTLARADEVRPDEIRCAWDVEVRVEGAGRPALVAQWLIQLKY